MGSESGLQAMIPSKKEIGFMVMDGFGLFLSITGMAGITLIVGPLNLVIKDLDYTLVFDNTALAFLICLGFSVAGGALAFVAKSGLRAMERQKEL